MRAPAFRVVATRPFTETLGDAAGRPMTDMVAASTEERSDAEIIARALRAQGWSVEIRVWTRRQRRRQDRLGRWRWYAGFVEYHA